MFRKSALVPAILLSMGTAALAQTTGPDPATDTDSPCQITPGAPTEDGSLTDTLDDCNGVLKPPMVGDPEIVEPAPSVGDTPVIAPDELPDQPQQDTPESGDSTGADQPGYTVGQIVDAIAQSGKIAEDLAGADAQSIDAQSINVRDVSILFDGIDAAVINASLSAHQNDVQALQKQVVGSPDISAALETAGLLPAGVVAGEISSEGTVTIFAR